LKVLCAFRVCGVARAEGRLKKIPS